MKGKKILAVLAICLICLTAAIVSYKLVAGKQIRERTYAHLETLGYTQDDIEHIEVKHAFLNKLLGYNEWRIFVKFHCEPDILFAFTYREREIVKQGTASETEQLNVDEIRKYNTMFENGELKAIPYRMTQNNH